MRLKDLLLEIGDTSPYAFTQKNARAKTYGRGEDEEFRGLKARYQFETEEGTLYEIKFESFSNTRVHGLENPLKAIRVDFESKEHKSYWGHPEPLTGEHDFYRIFSTVFSAAKHLYSEYSEYIDGFLFSGGMKDADRESIESQRSRLYRYFVERKLPNADIKTVYQGGSNYFYVELN